MMTHAQDRTIASRPDFNNQGVVARRGHGAHDHTEGAGTRRAGLPAVQWLRTRPGHHDGQLGDYRLNVNQCSANWSCWSWHVYHRDADGFLGTPVASTPRNERGVVVYALSWHEARRAATEALGSILAGVELAEVGR